MKMKRISLCFLLFTIFTSKFSLARLNRRQTFDYAVKEAKTSNIKNTTDLDGKSITLHIHMQDAGKRDVLSKWKHNKRSTEEREARIVSCGHTNCINGECVETEDKNKYCRCYVGYEGETCDKLIDECKTNWWKCGSEGECYNHQGTHVCLCPNNKIGLDCVNIFDIPCGPNKRSLQKFGSEPDLFIHCTGNNSFVAKRCPKNLYWDQEGQACLHSKPEEKSGRCSDYPCLNGGKCVDVQTGYVCLCPEGYNGRNCDRAIDYCKNNPCGNGTCNSWNGGYTCVCPGKVIDNCCCNNVTNKCKQEKDGFYKHNATSYVQCGPSGEAFLMHCAPGLIWNDTLNTCTYAYSHYPRSEKPRNLKEPFRVTSKQNEKENEDEQSDERIFHPLQIQPPFKESQLDAIDISSEEETTELPKINFEVTTETIRDVPILFRMEKNKGKNSRIMFMAHSTQPDIVPKTMPKKRSESAGIHKTPTPPSEVNALDSTELSKIYKNEILRATGKQIQKAFPNFEINIARNINEDKRQPALSEGEQRHKEHFKGVSHNFEAREPKFVHKDIETEAEQSRPQTSNVAIWPKKKPDENLWRENILIKRGNKIDATYDDKMETNVQDREEDRQEHERKFRSGDSMHMILRDDKYSDTSMNPDNENWQYLSHHIPIEPMFDASQ